MTSDIIAVLRFHNEQSVAHYGENAIVIIKIVSIIIALSIAGWCGPLRRLGVGIKSDSVLHGS